VDGSEGRSRAGATARARARADGRETARLALLTRVGELAASELDGKTMLARVAKVAVPDFAAWCVVDTVEADGSLRRLTVAHGDPGRAESARALERRPLRSDDRHGAAAVARTGRPELLRTITEEQLASVAREDRELLATLRGLGLTSSMCVPLVARGRTLGTLTLVRDDPSRPFDEADLDIALGIARRAAVVVDKARLLDELRQSEERYRLLFDANPLPMWVYDSKTFEFLAVNDAAIRRYGYSREEFLGMTILEIRPREDVEALLQSLAAGTGSPLPRTWKHRIKDGTYLDVEITAGRIVFDGRPAALVLANDVTERKKLEEQLAQAQKLESLGRLAGGVAHDFNNLLTVISGYVSMLRRRRGSARSPELAEVSHAAELAASLTRQLLAFSRRQVLQPRLIDVNEVVAALEPLLARLIGEHVDIAVRLTPDLPRACVDRSRLEGVIMNLAANARDAMPRGGRLTIETSRVVLDEDYASTHLEGTPGPNVMLAVSDTGIGMSAEVLAHLFEPFFTTKEVGAGTGLGLASVFGTVKQSGGSIFVYSEEGGGTTFKIYLPVASADEPETEPPAPEPARLEGTESILLVEDDPLVRELVRVLLEEFGYRVLVAESPEEAEAVCRDGAGPIDLLLADLVMPRLSGPELAERLAAIRPGLRVLFMSGYADEAVVRHGLITPGTPFVEKPFTEDALGRKVREALER
jgi:two-component system cell cycle sensor histidine kinase/response regulator CckA